MSSIRRTLTAALHSDAPLYTATCCASTASKSSFSYRRLLDRTYHFVGCALYVDCDIETAPPPPLDPKYDLAEGWTVAIPCAVDNPSRVLANIVVSYAQSTTPYSCTTQCQSEGYQYAGIEYGDECYCGTGYVDDIVPPVANTSDCNVPCAGDYYYTCGGSWRMEIFTSA